MAAVRYIDGQPLQSATATKFSLTKNSKGVGSVALSQEEYFMADDMEKKKGQQGSQTGQQHGQEQQGGQSGQFEPKKGGQGQKETEEDDQDRDRQRRAS